MILKSANLNASQSSYKSGYQNRYGWNNSPIVSRMDFHAFGDHCPELSMALACDRTVAASARDASVEGRSVEDARISFRFIVGSRCQYRIRPA